MNIIINRSDAIGDLILTLPILKKIRNFDPDIKIILLISPRTKDLMPLLSHLVDEFFIFDQKDSFFKKMIGLYQFFRKARAEYFLHVGGAQLPILMAKLSGVPHRGGLVSKLLSFLFLNLGIRQSRTRKSEHEESLNLDLLNGLNLIPKDEFEALKKDVYFNTERFKEQSFLGEFNKVLQTTECRNVSDWIIIHPGMSGHTLNWPSVNYRKFIEEMECVFPGKYLYMISFTPSDKDYLKDVENLSRESQNPENLYFLNGKEMGLINYLEVLSHAKLFLGPSTGNTHMANILGVPQICLYSPLKAQSEVRWGPLIRNSKVKVVTPQLEDLAEGVSLEKYCEENICMDKITVEHVVELARELLSEELPNEVYN